jgi:hypothetical protein
MALFMLTATARAEEAAPAAAATTPPAGDAAAAPPSTPKPEATPPAPPADQTAAELAPVAWQPTASPRKLQVGASFLPMGMGKYTYSDTYSTTATSEAYFAYGFGLSVGYEVLRGLIVGFSPQALFNVQMKPSDTAHPDAMKEFDLMARVAYAYRIVDTISVYAELLPGYSLILPQGGLTVSKGLVMAFGAGCTMDMTDRFFVNLGAGYQMGFQSQSEGVHKNQLRTKYVRLALGGGVRF